MNTKLFALFSILTVIAVGIPALFRYTSRNTSQAPSATPTAIAQQNPTGIPKNYRDTPAVLSPQPNDRVTNPLVVKGTVPPGWMFEEVFPVKLVDADRKTISEAQAKETTPGSWNSGASVEFSASLSFSTSAKSGYIVLEKDNPSGMPEQADSFEIPIKFGN